ncbi:hypothetical protein ACYCFL_13260 [Stutzerimonas nitrititolerans]|uniref:hypothetical protein n=1 Tax=Stutzerimonas nitrititolerans TaxID=2482751 RepID=UPI00026D8685|nr:hypothetical protein [Stutzerimonas nitrititolerans]AFN76274.1 hypothetical protein PSJM300_00960 [Stutzerimonas stutzeri DSM 10701]RRV24285.1 hypothetical protein EGJ29_08035 [Pseudomonas sp. s199]WAD25093.1 hypothetical protein OS670_11645 [Pseudomonadaceae bacterium T75]SUD82881.1 Uncharacterised protein [Stutzerimonas stutzeri]MBT1120351.1 hypothetical protein [Stutzerimonas nitrititolerans]
MPPVSDRERLLELHAQLQQALQAGDWSTVAAVDVAVRQCLEVLAGRSELDKPTLAAKRLLKQLHGEGLQACADECERLRLLLLNHLEYAEGRAAYQRIDMFQAGGLR